MAVKRYNKVSHTFMINGESIAFYCETTNTRDGFCHHVWAYGGGKECEHTRVKYYNRTWETFDYETAMRAAAAKYPKATKEALLLEIDMIGKQEADRAKKLFQAFTANFARLSTEQKTFLREHASHLETREQGTAVAAVVAGMAALNTAAGAR